MTVLERTANEERMTEFGTEGNRENGECRHCTSIRFHPNPPRQQGTPTQAFGSERETSHPIVPLRSSSSCDPVPLFSSCPEQFIPATFLTPGSGCGQFFSRSHKDTENRCRIACGIRLRSLR